MAIDLNTHRQNRQWVKNARRVVPILKAVEAAPEGEKKEWLFWAACRFRELIDEGALRHKGAWSLLRTAGFSLPSDERDRTISAGLFKGKRRR